MAWLQGLPTVLTAQQATAQVLQELSSAPCAAPAQPESWDWEGPVEAWGDRWPLHEACSGATSSTGLGGSSSSGALPRSASCSAALGGSARSLPSNSERWERPKGPGGPRSPARRARPSRRQEDFSRREEVWELQRGRRQELLRQALEAQELAECSFQPNAAQGRPRRRAGSEEVTARLAAASPWALRREELAQEARRKREEDALRQCTFAPDVSRSSQSLSLSVPSAQLSLDSEHWQALRRPPRREAARQPHGCHKPSTNSVRADMAHARAYLAEDVFSRLSQPQPELPAEEAPHGREASATEGRELSVRAFLRRQEEHEEERGRRLEQLESHHAPVFRPLLNRASLRLAERRQRSASRRKSSSPSRSPEQPSFRPRTSPSTACRPPRGTWELSVGDAARREAALAERREERLREELQPQLGKAAPAAGCLRVLESPEAYMGRIRERQEAREARREAELRQREEAEMQQCTFRPHLGERGPPGHVRLEAELHRTLKMLREKENCGREAAGSRPDWR